MQDKVSKAGGGSQAGGPGAGSVPREESRDPIEDELSVYMRSDLSPAERARLIGRLWQRLASTEFAHGESLSMQPALADMCVDSKSNMLDEWELACLCSCIVNFDWKPDDYLIEIGTNIGQTAVFMAKVLRSMGLGTKIISVDPFSFAADKMLNPKGNYSYYVTLTRQQNVNDMCIPVTAFSQDIPHIFKENVGVLLVDGSHQYEDVKKDLDYYSGLVRPNGYVFVDDYNASNYPGVYGAFDEWLAGYDNFELSYKDSYFVIAKKIRD